MPSNLPQASAYTYCADLSIDGVRDDETVSFDNPVIMYVDNFLGFDIGSIVPIGYYDRNEAVWKASKNGLVVSFLDTNADGKIDALDSTGDGKANDLNSDGSFEDEVVGIADNSKYKIGTSYLRGEITHFTPWDFNWPFGVPSNATTPKSVDTSEDEADKPKATPNPENKHNEPIQCTGSYVTLKTRVLHEDINIKGTNLTLHYSSNRAHGYKYEIDVKVDKTDMPLNVKTIIINLSVAGKKFVKTFLPSDFTGKTSFIWDGRDFLDNKLQGRVKAKVKVQYEYESVYYLPSGEFSQAWAQASSTATNIISRTNVLLSKESEIYVNIQSNSVNNKVANAWSISNIHNLASNTIIKGDGTNIQKNTMFTDGLVAHYAFEDNLKDSSGQELHGIKHGKLSYKDGVLGKAVRFSNYMDLIELPNDSLKNSVNSTVSFWLKGIYNGTHTTIVSALSPRYNNEYRLGFDSKAFQTYVYTGPRDPFISSNQIFDENFAPDKFKLITIVTSANKQELYINGILDTSKDVNIRPFDITSSIWLGNDQDCMNGCWTSEEQYIGLLDDFRIYNKSLSQEEVQKLYNKTLDDINSSKLILSSNNEEYEFDLKGNHLFTKDLFTKKTLTSFTYDDKNQLVNMKDSFNNTINISRDANDNISMISSANGHKTYLDINEKGDLLSVRYEDNTQYSFQYDDQSLLKKITNQKNKSSIIFYDQAGKVIKELDRNNGEYLFLKDISNTSKTYSIKHPLGDIYSYKQSTLDDGSIKYTNTDPSLDIFTRLLSKDAKQETITSNGVIQTNTFTKDIYTQESILKQSVLTKPSNLSKTITYNTNYIYDENENDSASAKIKSRIKTISSNNKTLSIKDDYENSLSIITSPQNRVITTTYDENTKQIKQIQSGSLYPTNYTYDNKGRLIKQSIEDKEASYTYTSRGNISTYTNYANKTTSYEYDIMDNLIKVNYPNNTSEEYSYDNNSNLIKILRPNNSSHDFTFTSLDKRNTYTSALDKQSRYTYNKNRKLISIIRPSLKSIVNTYTNDKLVKLSTNSYDISYEYFYKNILKSIIKDNEKLSFTYDGDLLTSIIQTGVFDNTISYTYNNDFNISSTSYANKTYSYTYDKDNLLLSSGTYNISRDTLNAYPLRISDTSFIQDMTYDSYRDIKKVSTNSFSYEILLRDKNSLILKKEEIVNNISIIYDYTYDDKQRLIEVKRNNNTIEQYTYDDNSNRINSIVNNIQASSSYTLDDQIEVYANNTYTYDEDGYLKQKVTPINTTNYTYLELGELKEVSILSNTQNTTLNKTITYKHNASNQRIAKLVNGVITQKYLWKNLTQLLAIYDKDDNLIQRYDYASLRMPVSMLYNGSKYYLHYDQVGSLRIVSNSSHDIVKEIVYDSFGNILSDSNPSFYIAFRYAGGLYDEDTMLSRFGYRDYDSYIAKWTAKDPIDFSGGDSNLYSYVLNDGVNFVDPSGLLVPQVIGAVIGIYLHYTRNQYNDTSTYDQVTLVCGPWALQSDDKSIFHRMGEGNENNNKYVHPNGSEAVYNTKDELITNSLNMGTYNYINNSTSTIGHGLVDVVPYFIFGNTPSDMFTTDRFKVLVK